MRKHCSDACKLCPCLDKESKKSARLCTIVTAAPQWQYSQTELIFWISLVQLHYPFVCNYIAVWTCNLELSDQHEIPVESCNSDHKWHLNILQRMYGMKNSSVCRSLFRLIVQASNTAWIKGSVTLSSTVNVQLQAQSLNIRPYFDLKHKPDVKT